MSDTTSRSAAPMSLHERILTDIQQLILSGTWQPGHKIPIEHELMKQYKCSRMTVSKVLTQLANARMIERRRKSGSFVSRPHSQSAVLTIPDIKTEVTALGLPYSFEVLHKARRKTTKEERDVLGFEQSVPVLEIECRHLAGQRSFCFEHRLINLEAVPEAAKETFAELAPGAWLLQRVPWTLAEHRIRAVVADAHSARMLGIARGSAMLSIERTTQTAELAAITFVRLIYPGDQHELVASFLPERAGRRTV